MNSFNKSFVTELTKIAQSGSSTSNLAKLLALGGLGYGGYKMYQANQANQAQAAQVRALGNLGYQLATAAQAARSARNTRNKRLLGLGLGAGALGAAHHFGLDSSILEKVKGLFGGGAAEAAAADVYKPNMLEKFVNLAKNKLNAGIDATKAGKEYGEVRKAFGIPALDVEGGPNQYGYAEANKNFLFNKATGKMLYNEPGMVSTKEHAVISPSGEKHLVPNRPYAYLPAAQQFKALARHLDLPTDAIDAKGVIKSTGLLNSLSPEQKEYLVKSLKEIKAIDSYQNLKPSSTVIPPSDAPSRFGIAPADPATRIKLR